jgi:uncharacterized repeat protein (TIGR03847 family)
LSRSFDLDPADRFTAGAVGEPGDRTFFVQARNTGEFLTLVCEKQQVFLLARELRRVLSMLPDDEDETPVQVEPYDLELVEPLEPEWRIGSMSIEFDPERDRIIVLFRELDVEAMELAAAEALEALEAGDDDAVEDDAESDDDEDDDDEDDDDDDTFIGEAIARIVVTRTQVQAMAEHAMDVVAAGRPRCPICGEPMDAGVEHACIVMNGHRKR